VQPPPRNPVQGIGAGAPNRIAPNPGAANPTRTAPRTPPGSHQPSAPATQPTTAPPAAAQSPAKHHFFDASRLSPLRPVGILLLLAVLAFAGVSVSALVYVAGRRGAH
jgi:hypothetical protein